MTVAFLVSLSIYTDFLKLDACTIRQANAGGFNFDVKHNLYMDTSLSNYLFGYFALFQAAVGCLI